MKKPRVSDMVLYCTFAKDCEDIGLSPPSYTQFIEDPGRFEALYFDELRKIARLSFDEPPEWFAASMGWA